MADSDDSVVDDISAEEVQEAANLGWVDKPDFRGNPDRWVGAREFLDRGKHIMPILQKNNERLQNDLRQQAEKTTKLEQLLAASQESIQALEEHYTAANKRQVETARKELLAELRAAKSSGDLEAEVDITDQLTQIKEVKEPAEKKPAVATEAVAAVEAPEVRAFRVANPWYGVDVRKTIQFNRFAEDLRLDGNKLIGREFLDAAMTNFEKANRSTVSRVEPGSNRGNGGTTKSGRFADLPAEAKEACRADAKRLVGEGRRFKTIGDWETRYAEIYFGDAQ